MGMCELLRTSQAYSSKMVVLSFSQSGTWEGPLAEMGSIFMVLRLNLGRDLSKHKSIDLSEIGKRFSNVST